MRLFLEIEVVYLSVAATSQNPLNTQYYVSKSRSAYVLEWYVVMDLLILYFKNGLQKEVCRISHFPYKILPPPAIIDES